MNTYHFLNYFINKNIKKYTITKEDKINRK